MNKYKYIPFVLAGIAAGFLGKNLLETLGISFALLSIITAIELKK